VYRKRWVRRIGLEQSTSTQGYLLCFHILHLAGTTAHPLIWAESLYSGRWFMKIRRAKDRPRSGCAAITARSQGPRRCCCLGYNHKSWRSCLNTPGQNSPSPARRSVGAIAPTSSTLPGQTSAPTGPRHAIRYQQGSPGTATRFHSFLSDAAPRDILSAPRSGRHDCSASCVQLGL
jgi:hypothetical protein